MLSPACASGADRPPMLPSTIPIFPLPNVVLFPGVFLPLHIFEERYRALVRDALAGDRLIGIVLLRPGWEDDYEGAPEVYDLGCAGLITHSERLEDGGFNIVLHGMAKFRILSEEQEVWSYRRARVEMLDEPMGDAVREEIRGRRHQLETLLAPMIDSSDQHLPEAMPEDELVNALSQYLDLEPVERQALLECRDVVTRCAALIELLEMKAMLPGSGWNGAEPH